MPASTFEYWNGSAWTNEPNYISLSIIDELFSPLAAEIVIANHDGAGNFNSKEATYTNYLQVRIIEGNTSRVIFYGRVERIKPEFNGGYGQTLIVYARDNLQELLKRTNRTEYTSTTTRSSQISTIVSNHIYAAASIDTSDTDKYETSSDTVSAGDLNQDFDHQNKSALRSIAELANSDENSDASGWIFYLDTTFSGTTAAPDLHYFARGTRPQGGPNTNGMHIEFKGTEADAASPTRNGVRSILPDYSFPKEPRELVTRTRVIYTDSAGSKKEIHGILVNHDTPTPGSFLPGNAITWAGGGAGRIEYSSNSFTVIGPTNGDLTNTDYLIDVSNTVLTSTVGSTDYTANANLATADPPGSQREAIGQDVEIVERRYENTNITGAREIAKQILYQGGNTVQRGSFRIMRYPYVRFTGTHTGSNESLSLTDSSGDFIDSGIFAGDMVHNTTDGSSATISSRTATILAGTLSGGTDNDWDNGDAYRIDVLVRAGQDIRLVSIPGVTDQDAIITKIAYQEGPGMQESHIEVLFHDTGRGFTLPKDIFSSIFNRLETSESSGGALDLSTEGVFKKLLGRPQEYLDTGYPAVHPAFGQPLNVRPKWFWRENFGSWVTESLAAGGLEWAGSIDLAQAAIYWNISAAQIAGTDTSLDITDILYVAGTGALFGKEQVLYGAFLARMNFGNYADDYSNNTSEASKLTGAQNTQAAKFDGSSQYFSHADHADLDLGTGDFTWEVSFNIRSLSTDQPIIRKEQSGTDYYTLLVDNTDDTLSFLGVTGGSTTININSSIRITDSGDHHVVIVADRDSAANTKMFVDGADVTNGTPTIDATDIDNSGIFYIGYSPTGTIYYDGRIHHVRLWKTALTDAQVAVLYNSGFGSYVDAKMLLASGTPGAATASWDLRVDANDSAGCLDLSDTGCIEFGGTYATGNPTTGETSVAVDDPNLFKPNDYFGVLLPKWLVFNDGVNTQEAMLVDAPGVKATGEIIFDGQTGNVAASDTVTINGKVYTYVSTVPGSEGEVAVGSDYVVSARNLYNAIIKGPQGGAAYQAASAHANVVPSFKKSVSATGTAQVVITLTAKHFGALSNSISLSECATNVTVSGATLTGGSDTVTLTLPRFRDVLYFPSAGLPIADETVTIDGRVYTWKAAPNSAYEVDIGGDATTCRDNFVKAVNATGTDDVEYGTGTLAHPRVWAFKDGNQGADRNLVIESRDVNDEIQIPVSTSPGGGANVHFLNRDSSGQLNKATLWDASNNTNIDSRDYPFKSFGFGNAADPNCCVMELRDGRFEALSRRQGKESRRVLDYEYDKYLTNSLDPQGTRNWVVKWTRDVATFLVTSSFASTDPDRLEFIMHEERQISNTSDSWHKVPYWPLEMDIINYYVFDNTINVPWIEYYAVPDEGLTDQIDGFTQYSGQTADVLVVAPNPGLVYRGFSVKESASTAATAEFNIRHGDNDNEIILEGINLVANESGGLSRNASAPKGIFLEVVSGTIDITIYWARQDL
jgi:hypothetical protein